MTANCTICSGSGEMEAKHPTDGQPIWLECWCQDEQFNVPCYPMPEPEPGAGDTKYLGALQQIKAILRGVGV